MRPARYNVQLRSERGTSIVEMCIVMSIMGILALVSIGMITSVFNSQAQASAMDSQRNERNAVIDYLESNLNSVEVGEIGLLTDDNQQVNPVSLAGDQMVFRAGSNCYRVFLVARTKELRAAASTSGCDPIEPVRGPNEIVPGGGYQLDDPEDPLYDPVLDEEDSFVLAGNVALDEDGFTFPDVIPMLVFLDSQQEVLFPLPDNQADSQSVSPAYLDPALLDSISSVRIEAAITASQGVNTRLFERTFFLNS